jgi:hypothetical protein
MVQLVRGPYTVDEKGKPTAVILDIQKYRKMLSLVQERLDRKESKLLPYFTFDGAPLKGYYNSEP